MSGRTPGPWRVGHRAPGQGVPVLAHDPVYPVARAYSHHKYRRGQGYTKLFDAEDNARLIAAAPELLEAAKAYLATTPPYVALPRKRVLREALEAAVAKAEGFDQ